MIAKIAGYLDEEKIYASSSLGGVDPNWQISDFREF